MKGNHTGPMSLTNRIAIITGAGGTLGRAVTRTFLENKARVIACDVNENALKELADSSPRDTLDCITTDLMSEKSIVAMTQDVVGRYGKIDVLVNLAGGYLGGVPIAETTEEQWDFMMNLNLKTVFLCGKSVFPIMQRQKYGRIVNVAARPGLRGEPGIAAYSASKAGVINFTQALAAEGLEFNINANAVLPSIIDTPPNRAGMPDADFSAWVSPENLANVILFLASEASASTSGAALPVYGNS